jgi:hypothetical protein
MDSHSEGKTAAGYCIIVGKVNVIVMSKLSVSNSLCTGLNNSRSPFVGHNCSWYCEGVQFTEVEKKKGSTSYLING